MLKAQREMEIRLADKNYQNGICLVNTLVIRARFQCHLINSHWTALLLGEEKKFS